MASGKARITGGITVLILLLLALFHVAVILKLVPGNMVWGGGASSSSEDVVEMETIALGVSLFFALIAAGRSGLLWRNRFRWFFSAGSWVMTGYFLLNSVGNLLSESSLERAIFLPLSLLLFLLSFFVSLGSRQL